MRVGYLNSAHADHTGAGQFSLHLLRAMQERKVDFDIITHTDRGFLPRGFFRALFSLRRIIERFDGVDIIHALDGWPYGYLGALVARKLRKPLIITAIGTGAVKPLHQFIKKQLLSWAYRQAAAITAVSTHTKEEICKVLPELEHTITVIPHGVTYEKYQKIYELPVGVREPYIVSIGALKLRKGFTYSLEAFALLAKDFPTTQYVIVGRGPERSNLEEQARQLGITKQILFLDHVSSEEKVALYQKAKVFIMLSQDVGYDLEGFGLVFLEAAASGLPVIATRGTGAEDAVREGVTGFLVSQQNGQEAGQKLIELFRQPALRERMAGASRAFGKEMSWGKAADAYRSVYEHLN